jgi:hypothetical protein
LLNGQPILRLRLLGPPQVDAGSPLAAVDLVAHKRAALMFYLASPRSRR